MDTLTLDGEIYFSSKHAAKVTGYAKDYVGQLCREGAVDGRLVGRNWYVREQSIREHRFGNEKHADSTNSLTEAVEEEVAAPAVRYTTEKVTQLPRADEVIRKPAQNLVQDNVTPIHSDKMHLVSMQHAWQEWFTKVQTRIQNEHEESVRAAEEGAAVEESVSSVHEAENKPYEESDENGHQVSVSVKRTDYYGKAATIYPNMPRNRQHRSTNDVHEYLHKDSVLFRFIRALNIVLMVAALAAFLVVAVNFLYKDTGNSTSFITGTYIYTAK